MKGCTADDLKKLFAEFPQEDVRWRAQTLSRDGNKALALAYIDARDVMDRLDQICGAENWQDRYEAHGSRTICYLSIRVDGEWITKADGAGDTDVEAEKGAISDALKRAAVKWGIGRYLYSLGDTWVPCETREQHGKRVFAKFTDDPWRYVKGYAPPPKSSASLKKTGPDGKDAWDRLQEDLTRDLLDCHTISGLEKLTEHYRKRCAEERWPMEWRQALKPIFDEKRKFLVEAAEAADAAAEQTMENT